MSQYNEEMKEEVGEALKQWLLSEYRLTEKEIDVYTYPGTESYVSVELSFDANFDGFDTERVRSVVKNNTDYRVDSILDRTTYTIDVAPE